MKIDIVRKWPRPFSYTYKHRYVARAMVTMTFCIRDVDSFNVLKDKTCLLFTRVELGNIYANVLINC